MIAILQLSKDTTGYRLITLDRPIKVSSGILSKGSGLYVAAESASLYL
jgi:hypothetical protein